MLLLIESDYENIYGSDCSRGLFSKATFHKAALLDKTVD